MNRLIMFVLIMCLAGCVAQVADDSVALDINPHFAFEQTDRVFTL